VSPVLIDTWQGICHDGATMCEFCHQHGEGKTWYLNANNYAEDLLSDLRRRHFITRFFETPGHLAKGERALTALDVMPDFLWKGVRTKITARQKPKHFGQVVPIEDIERILALTTSVVRLACLCRHVSVGKEQRYCFGVSMEPNGGGVAKLLREIDASYLVGPHTAGLESMSKENALARIRETEHEGNCHTIWTFITPFLAGICNCSLPGCFAMKTTVTHKSPVFFRGEYVARVDAGACSGCGQCVKICSFKAFKPRKKKDKAEIDPLRCYGCGICRSACVKAAISLVDRADVPAAASLWL
jgi:Pyruvate/2-oxoacid:ferredoxin oxidoreductase delta subunit